MSKTLFDLYQRFPQDRLLDLYTAAQTTPAARLLLDYLHIADQANELTPEFLDKWVTRLKNILTLDRRETVTIQGELTRGEPHSGLILGQVVKVGLHLSKAFPGEYKILGFGTDTVLLEMGEFHISFIEVI